MYVVLFLAYGAFSPYLVLGSDEVVDDVRAGRVAAGVAEPLLADVASNHRSLEMSKAFSNHFWITHYNKSPKGENDYNSLMAFG